MIRDGLWIWTQSSHTPHTYLSSSSSLYILPSTPCSPPLLMYTPTVAWFLTLWFSLGEYDFKHKVAKAWLQHRKATWQKCCKFVFDDRTANAKTAWNARQAAPQTTSAIEDDDRKGVVSVKAPVDQKYWWMHPPCAPNRCKKYF